MRQRTISAGGILPPALRATRAAWTLALAIAAAAPHTLGAEPIAKVLSVSGVSSAQTGVATRILGAHDSLTRTDVISVGPDSHAVIEFSDRTRMSLRPNTVFRVEAYSTEKPENALFGLLRGGFRAVTGFLSKRGTFQVAAPTATIGIRGTEFDARLCEEDCAQEEARYATAAARSRRVVARVVEVNGTATVAGSGSPRLLVPGAVIYAGEDIATEAGGYALLAFRDGTRITLAEGGRLAVERFDFDEATPQEGRAHLRLVSGSAHVWTGRLAKISPDAFRFETALGPIRPHGTGFSVSGCIGGVCGGASASVGSDGAKASGSVSGGGASVGGSMSIGSGGVGGSVSGGVPTSNPAESLEKLVEDAVGEAQESARKAAQDLAGQMGREAVAAADKFAPKTTQEGAQTRTPIGKVTFGFDAGKADQPILPGGTVGVPAPVIDFSQSEEQKQNAERDASAAMDQAKAAAKKTGEAVDAAADKVKQGAGNATAKLRDVATDAADAGKNAGDKAAGVVKRAGEEAGISVRTSKTSDGTRTDIETDGTRKRGGSVTGTAGGGNVSGEVKGEEVRRSDGSTAQGGRASGSAGRGGASVGIVSAEQADGSRMQAGTISYRSGSAEGKAGDLSKPRVEAGVEVSLGDVEGGDSAGVSNGRVMARESTTSSTSGDSNKDAEALAARLSAAEARAAADRAEQRARAAAAAAARQLGGDDLDGYASGARGAANKADVDAERAEARASALATQGTDRAMERSGALARRAEGAADTSASSGNRTGVEVSVWDGAVEVGAGDERKRVRQGEKGVLAEAGGKPVVTVAAADPEATGGPPRPDKVKTDISLFGREPPKTPPGLYVWVREGAVVLNQGGETVEVGPGEAAVATQDKTTRLEAVPNFMRFDRTPLPQHGDASVLPSFRAPDGAIAGMCVVK